MAGYTSHMIAKIRRTYLMAASFFAAGTACVAWKGWPPEFPELWSLGAVLSLLVALIIVSFPLSWVFFPAKHPVRRALAPWGNFRQISARLDAEMSDRNHLVIGPFHFTQTMLIYEQSWELDIVPYDQIIAAKAELDADSTWQIVINTHNGLEYRWSRTWMQGGFFDREQLLAKIRNATDLDGITK